MAGLELLQSILHLLSTALLYPVIIALLILLGWVLIKAGEFISEYSLRNRDVKKTEARILDARRLLKAEKIDESVAILKNSCSNPLVASYANDLSLAVGIRGEPQYRYRESQVEKLLQDYELRALKKLEPTKIVAQIAPMLGLMGTLIPLGPGLVGLMEGNFELLARSLIIAFSTTVLGLLIGLMAYAITTIRRRWYFQDISDIEYITVLLFGKTVEKDDTGIGAGTGGRGTL